MSSSQVVSNLATFKMNSLTSKGVQMNSLTLKRINIYIYIYNCASASDAVSLPPLWYQSHSLLAGE